MTGSGAQEEVGRDIARLFEFDRQGCLELWSATFEARAPKHISLLLLQKMLAYEVQAKALGGLPAKARRALEAIAAGRAYSRPDSRIRAGTRLVREWNGRTHEVEVLTDGFAWKGRRFRSLSAVAREITGARWSGPRFFGTRA